MVSVSLISIRYVQTLEFETEAEDSSCTGEVAVIAFEVVHLPLDWLEVG